MIKRIIHISKPAYIRTEDEQIIFSFKDDGEILSVPTDDLGILIIDSPQVTITSGAIAKLMEYKSVINICDKSHIPSGIFYTTQGNFAQTKRFANQVNAKITLKKRLWADIIKQKLWNQADLLKKYHKEYLTLLNKIPKIKSGDSTNQEGTASQHYWKELFKDTELKRDREGLYPNNLLNFGYAVIRAITARAICASGLHPSLGLFHKNVYNAFCLADDLMEPYRQFIDDAVYSYYLNPEFGKEINKDIKKMLINISYSDVIINNERHPLFIGISHTVNSLNNCFDETCKKMDLPGLCS